MTVETTEDRVLAAEYALRLLDGDDLLHAAQRALTDRAFAGEIRLWESRFAGLTEDIPPLPPSRASKRALMSRLFGHERRPWFARTSLWAATTAATLLFAAFLGNALRDAQQTPSLYTTELASEDGSLRVLAVYDSVSGHIRLTRTAGGAGDGRDLQLWGIGADGVPVPVGVLPDDQSRSGYAVPARLANALDGLTLAISDEPDGGSPTGAPTGDVLAVGVIEEI